MNIHELALMLEHDVRYIMVWEQQLTGTDFSADSIESGFFIEAMDFCIKQSLGNGRSIDNICFDASMYSGKPMKDIGVEKCAEFLNAFEAELNIPKAGEGI